MSKREQIMREYKAAYIADFGEDPPVLTPDGPGFVMTDDVFPSHHSFFYSNEIKQMVEWMRERLLKKQ